MRKFYFTIAIIHNTHEKQSTIYILQRNSLQLQLKLFSSFLFIIFSFLGEFRQMNLVHSNSQHHNNNNNNNNHHGTNGFEFHTNGCSHSTATSITVTNENSINNQSHKELMQQARANKCKPKQAQAQAQARTNGVYHHNNGINGTTHLTQTGGKHQLAHVINSLSSPESAYSTGYSSSCDGTSPGMYQPIE